MRRRSLVLPGLAATALLVPLAGVASAAPASHTSGSSRPTPKPQVVVAGLNNPRQLSLPNEHRLYIAEAGIGGNLATITDPEGGTQGVGLTGSISLVRNPEWARNGTPHRIVTGLLSAAAPDGSGAIGSDGVSVRHGRILIQETAVPPGTVLPPRAARQSGKLLTVRDHGKLRVVADITAFEVAHNPDHQAVESDPYAVLQLRNYALVADAAANDVLKVDRHGHISVWHVFPNIVNATCLDPSIQQPPPNLPGCQFVPTSLATDEHGYVYVGGLGGLVPGQARVVKLTADGRHVLKTWTGLTSVTGVAVGEHGALYVSQLFAPEAHPANPAIQGVLTKITRNGHRYNTDVPFPAGIAVDDHTVYVSAFSIAPGTGLTDPSTGKVVPGTSGQVWRLRW